MAYLSRQLTEIVGSDADCTTVLLGGLDTAAVEAMRSSRSALVIDNGAYGQRMSEILEAYGITCQVFRASSTEPLDYDALEAMMRNKSPDCIAAVHSETPPDC
jgi:2-aminoethylphosphonate-pyruvate transaminase